MKLWGQKTILELGPDPVAVKLQPTSTYRTDRLWYFVMFKTEHEFHKYIKKFECALQRFFLNYQFLPKIFNLFISWPSPLDVIITSLLKKAKKGI
jgi:hypothetical protein